MSHGNIFVVDARTLIEKQKRISWAKGGILKRMESFNGIFHEGVGGSRAPLNVVFIEKSDFFSKKPPFVTKTFSFGENLHFNKSKRVFLAFCKIFGPRGGQKLRNAHNSNKAKSGVSQIHLRQLFHFINVRCNYCLQLSLSYPRFLQTGLNRRFLFIK